LKYSPLNLNNMRNFLLLTLVALASIVYFCNNPIIQFIAYLFIPLFVLLLIIHKYEQITKNY
jgi:hypothetical protein